MTISETLKKRWKTIIAILVLVVIVFIGYSIWSYELSVGWGAFGEISITEVNESVASQGYAISQGNVITLTEEDFKVVPKLAILKEGKERYLMKLWRDDGFTAHYGGLGFFKYNGKYYRYGPILLY